LGSDDDIHFEAKQLGRQFGKAFRFVLGESVFDDNALTLDITKISQPLAKGFKRGGRCGSLTGMQIADAIVAVRTTE
jgi:hypothetical protein